MRCDTARERGITIVIVISMWLLTRHVCYHDYIRSYAGLIVAVSSCRRHAKMPLQPYFLNRASSSLLSHALDLCGSWLAWLASSLYLSLARSTGFHAEPRAHHRRKHRGHACPTTLYEPGANGLACRVRRRALCRCLCLFAAPGSRRCLTLLPSS